MMHLSNDGRRLWWDEEDVVPMAKIIGAELATKRRAPYVASLPRLAERKKIQLSPRLERRYAADAALREEIKPWKKLKDAAWNEPRLFPWQRADLTFMEQFPCIGYLLAHEAGVGKTLESIRFKQMIPHGQRVLVVCPNSAKEQWFDELRRWVADPIVDILRGTKTEQIRTAAESSHWVIAHWEALVHARLGLLAKPWDLVIADEAHRAANRKAQRTDTLFELDARYKLALTAHAFTKDPTELYAILKFLYPEIYTSFWRFTFMHAVVEPQPFGGFAFLGARRPNLLRWEIAPFTLRRTKRSLGWRPPARIRRTVELTPRGRKEYDRLRKQFFAELAGHGDEEKIVAIPSALARVTRLRQYLVDPGLLGGREPSLKYPVALEIMEELNGPPVIFSAFQQAILRLGKFLEKAGRNVGYFHGDVRERERGLVKKAFVAGRLDALLVVAAAGGESLNLGGHGYVILLDPPWHPRGLEQLEGRVDRPEEGTGRLVPTTSYRIIVADSYEPKMEKRVNVRHADFKEVFTVSDYKELFA